MTIKSIAEVPKNPVAAGKNTWIQVLYGPDETPNFAMRKFTIEPGGSMPYHTNEVEHEQLVLRGRAEVVSGGTAHTLGAGDVTLIPAGEPHSYRCIGDEPFEFLCLVPNRDDHIEILQD